MSSFPTISFLAISLLCSIVSSTGISTPTRRVIPFLATVIDLNTHVCCGAVLNDRTILTTALCLESPLPLQVLVNTTRCHLNPEFKPFAVDVIHRVQGPNFNAQTSFGDIGIMHVEKSLQEKGAIPIQLMNRSLAIGDKVRVYGWNYDFILDKEFQQQFRADSTVIDPQTCVQHYGKSFDPREMICIDMWVGKDSNGEPKGCEMDPSSAAVIKTKDNSYEIGGLALFAGGCLYRGWPAVFLDTFKYQGWIIENLKIA